MIKKSKLCVGATCATINLFRNGIYLISLSKIISLVYILNHKKAIKYTLLI
jgi:hypothetical protein